MSEMDVSAWNEFRVGDLFALVNSKPYHTKDISFCEDGLNYVTRTMFDNGIKGCVEGKPDFVINPAGTISFGAENADFFYQKEPYITGNKMYYMDTRCISEEAALFLKTVLQTSLTYRFSFSEGMVPARIKDELISLPATPAGTPDWDYMENYMRQVMEKEEVFASQLEALSTEAAADGHEMDVSKWGEFYLYNIFNIDMGNKFDRGKMPVGEEVNFVGRTGLNNGVNAVCSKYQDMEPYPAGYLTLALGGTIGACFVQNEPFYTSQNVVVLKPKQDVCLAAKQFMACVIYNVSRSRYCAFSDELNKHIKTDFVFSLPVTSAGTPDWAYMERFMQQQMDKSRQLVEHLDQLI